MKKPQITENSLTLSGIFQKGQEKIYVWESRNGSAVYLENAQTGNAEQLQAKSSEDVLKFLRKKGYEANTDLKENLEVSWRQSKKKISEGLAMDAESCDRDHEVQMARAELYRAAEYSIALHKMLKSVPDDANLEGWVQAKITKASDYLASVKHYMEYEMASTGSVTVDSVDHMDDMDPMMESSVGGTSSGSVAAVVQPLGKMQRRTKKSGKSS
jgi:hypothetical protein